MRSSTSTPTPTLTLTEATLDRLRRFESRNVTFLDPDGTWPIVWTRARGAAVWDAEGKRYLDLTSAFGVAAAGHANPRVVRAGQRQMEQLLHGMGDVHPHPLKAQLAEALSALTFERWLPPGRARRPAEPRPAEPGRGASRPTHGKVLFGSSGFEAVEAALKTAALATGRPGIIAFSGAYHGLGYGALNATHRPHFRAPFQAQLRAFGKFAPFPQDAASLRATMQEIERLLGSKRIGAILVEPIQGRGGIRVPPASFLPRLRRACDLHGALLVLDEILTGFARTGAWFACEHSGTVPDLICLGKALTGGFPLSACVGRADVMDAAWPRSTGEAIHTSTYLGHPVGCAMALAQIQAIRRLGLVARAAGDGAWFMGRLREALAGTGGNLKVRVRGRGLLVGVELRHRTGRPAGALALEAVKRLLHRGLIVLPEGEQGEVLGLTPPLTIGRTALGRAVRLLAETVRELAR